MTRPPRRLAWRTRNRNIERSGMFSRREFLGASLATCAISVVRAQTNAPPTILRLERRTIEVNGKAASVLDIRQPGGALGVETEVGKAFRVRVENRLSEPSLIHWHGLTPPWRQDGVPNISSPPIPAGEDADFDFPLAFDGTFFMHSHQGLARAAFDVRAAHHSRSQRPTPAGDRRRTGRFQLQDAGRDLRGPAKAGRRRRHGRHGHVEQ